MGAIHIHIDIRAHNLGVDRDIERRRQTAGVHNLVEGVDIRILVGFSIGRIIERTIRIVGLMALGSQTNVHLRRTEGLIDLLQFSRGRSDPVTYLEGITGLKLVEREGTEGERYTEGIGVDL